MPSIEITGIAALDLAITLIASRLGTPDEIYASMADALEDEKLAAPGIGRDQHMFAMGYVLSLMHARQVASAPVDPSLVS